MEQQIELVEVDADVMRLASHQIGRSRAAQVRDLTELHFTNTLRRKTGNRLRELVVRIRSWWEPNGMAISGYYSDLRKERDIDCLLNHINQITRQI